MSTGATSGSGRPVQGIEYEHIAAMLLQEIERMTECCICLSYSKTMKHLPCQHMCCTICIEKMLQSAVLGNVLKCPLCRDNFRVPDRDPRSLPDYFLCKKLMELHLQYASKFDAAKAREISACSLASVTFERRVAKSSDLYDLEMELHFAQVQLETHVEDYKKARRSWMEERIMSPMYETAAQKYRRADQACSSTKRKIYDLEQRVEKMRALEGAAPASPESPRVSDV